MSGYTWIRSVMGTHFTSAIPADDKENENITGLAASGPNFVVRRVVVISKENLAWEVMLFGKDTFDTASPNTDQYLCSKIFSAGDGRRIAGAGLYRYDSGDVHLPYSDLDVSGELHIALANRSGVAKTAGVPGEVIVLLAVEG
jgi:hypothetical protein